MALKNKSLKKTLTEVAEENTSVTKGTRNEKMTLKEGAPRDLHTIQNNLNTVVGLSIGSTLNMGDFQSLRVDAWLTDEVKDGETTEQAYGRVFNILKKTLDTVVTEYVNGSKE